MPKSIKFTNDTYLDSAGVVHDRIPLKEMINGTKIYESDGTSETITFSENILQYKFFEVFYWHQSINCVQLVPNSESFTIHSVCWATSEIIQDAFLNYEIGSNNFSLVGHGYVNYSNNSVRNVGTSSPIKIYKIIAHR